MSKNHRTRAAKARRRTKRTQHRHDHYHVERYDDVVAIPYWEYPQAAKRAAEATSSTSVQTFIDVLMGSTIRVGPVMTPEGPAYPPTTFGHWAAETGRDVESLIYFLEEARNAGLLRWCREMRAYEMLAPL